jgi:hypothetical protein
MHLRHTILCVTVIAPMTIAGAQQPASIAERILAAADLPRIVDLLRRDGGIPEDQVKDVLDHGRKDHVPASEIKDVLSDADEAVKANGPVDNFGAFVTAQLDAGLRGRALAQAIRDEHARRGIGQGRMAGMGNAPGRGDDTTKGNASRGRSQNAGSKGAPGNPSAGKGQSGATHGTPPAAAHGNAPAASHGNTPATKGRPASPASSKRPGGRP